MSRMTFVVRIDAEFTELLDLDSCMHNEPQIKGAVVKRHSRHSEPGEMGPALEALSWAADNKELVGGLAAVLATWLAGRRTRIRVRAGSKEIDLTSSHVPDPEALALILLEALEEPDDDV